MSLPTTTQAVIDAGSAAVGWIGNIGTVYWIAYVLFAAVVVLVGVLALVWKREVRLFRNCRRPIKIFCTPGGPSMEVETKTLRTSGLFNIPEDPTSSYQDCHNITDHGLVIIGYAPRMPGLADILAVVKAKKIPLIVYTKAMLDPDDKALLETYPWYSLCNVPLRVVSDTFSILSTFPIPKHD